MKYALASLIIVSLCFLLPAAATAQPDALSAIQKIYGAYNTGNAIRFTGNLKMYIKSDPGKIIDKTKSTYVLRGGNFLCSIGPVEMLLNDNYYVSVDKSIKLIIIGNKKDISGTGQMPALNLRQFKKWIGEKTIEASVAGGGSNSILELIDAQGVTGYNLYSITYDAITGYMKKVVMEVYDNNDSSHKTVVLEINYTNPVAAEKNGN
ncbi:MAG: hypothetical protein ABUT20_58745, partial [Bacteroidota bacterium]